MSAPPVAPPFDRTTCACPECVSCCTRQPGSCVPGDIEAIAAYLGKPVRVVLARFCASPSSGPRTSPRKPSGAPGRPSRI